jgi:hypothetical protein
VPEISRFFGIVIAMYYREHDPPHFHVRYAGFHALVGMRPLAVLRGSIPPRVLGLVTEWAARHETELVADWERARRNEPLLPIPPLE